MTSIKPIYRLLLSACTVTLLVFLLFLYTSHKPPVVDVPIVVVPEEKPVDPELQAFIDEFERTFNAEFEHYHIPGAALAIVIDSSVTYVKTFGVKSVKTNEEIDQETRFRLASVSKGFASILASKLKKRHQFEWSDPLHHHLSEFKTIPNTYSDEVTLEHILSHSAGYPYQAYSTMIEDGHPRQSLFNALYQIPLSRKPGEIHAYQNVAYSLIEPVVEQLEDTSYQYILRKELFEPLNMAHASTSYDELLQSGNYAVPHTYVNKNRLVPIGISADYYNTVAAGGVNASITDMSLWVKTLLGQQVDVIDEEVLTEVFTPRIRTSVKNRFFSTFDRPRKGHYGLGWRIVEYPSDTLIYHGGYANGYKSEVAIDRQKQVGICILTNAPGRFCNQMTIEFFKKYKAYLASKDTIQ